MKLLLFVICTKLIQSTRWLIIKTLFLHQFIILWFWFSVFTFPKVLTSLSFATMWEVGYKVWCPAFGVQESLLLLESFETLLQKRAVRPVPNRPPCLSVKEALSQSHLCWRHQESELFSSPQQPGVMDLAEHTTPCNHSGELVRQTWNERKETMWLKTWRRIFIFFFFP